MTGPTSSRRRGPFKAGERVQLTDPKGRQYTISLTGDGYFQSTRGSFRHSELIGREEGTVVETEEGRRFLALRPLVSDYVLSMPRGATVVYPKDAAQIVHAADVFPGARVFEAGLGSGALTLSLLAAAGPGGHVLSAERRPEFAEIAEANVRSWYGEECPPWTIRTGEALDALEGLEEGELDHVILDMLAPWDLVEAAARALRPGGVVLAYVATTTQLSRFVEGAFRLGDPRADLASGGARRQARPPDGGAHGLPRPGPEAGARRRTAAADAQARQGRVLRGARVGGRIR